MENNTIERIPEPIMATLVVTCPCGLARLLDPGYKVGDTITLTPCPRCGAGFKGILVTPHQLDEIL